MAPSPLPTAHRARVRPVVPLRDDAARRVRRHDRGAVRRDAVAVLRRTARRPARVTSVAGATAYLNTSSPDPRTHREAMAPHPPIAAPPLTSAGGAYEPGVCNIGPAEIERRRRSGHVGLLVGLVVFAVLV